MAQLLAQQLSRLLQISFGLGLGLLGLSKSVYIVPPGHRAVIWDRLKGVKMGVVKGEGMHLLIPFWQTPYIIDVRKTPKNINTSSPSKDLQTVKITLRVLYRPNKKFLPQLFNEYGEDYDERLLPSLGNDVLKAVVVSRQIREQLTARSSGYYIILDDVSITHLAFSDEFTHAIEHKQVAQQEAERAKFIVERAEQERRAAVIRAEGEAEAARLITEATAKAGPALLELRRIEAAKEIAETLSEAKNVTFLPSGGKGKDGKGTAETNFLLSLR